ncbi:hypothetical protein [Streptomyces sp. NRRL S-350]|uniref:hypothetical protein n=1 Tax=Streptomyces sp. NRRL S-350 TaxID=1463902 RepID=UPI00131C572E|nr:hypothetical protein [Streptomyces sp. NRRL S-350]
MSRAAGASSVWSASAAPSAPAGPALPSAGTALPSAGTARVLQRVAEQAGLVGVPLTAVPARTSTTVQAAPQTGRSTASPSQAGARRAADAGGSPAEPADAHATGVAGIADLDELARRLVEPVGRLLRTELRRGRERSGRPYDVRR